MLYLADLYALQDSYTPYQEVHAWFVQKATTGFVIDPPYGWARHVTLYSSPNQSAHPILMHTTHHRAVVCVPPERTEAVFALYHSHSIGGHFSPSKMIAKISADVWWPQMGPI